MTREQAIFYIRELERLHASMDKKVAEAVDMAIEALQDRPEEVREDFRVCPLCGFVTEHNVCPNCGADLRGDNNE